MRFLNLIPWIDFVDVHPQCTVPFLSADFLDKLVFEALDKFGLILDRACTKSAALNA
jgi:hypothetical protein